MLCYQLVLRNKILAAEQWKKIIKYFNKCWYELQMKKYKKDQKSFLVNS